MRNIIFVIIVFFFIVSVIGCRDSEKLIGIKDINSNLNTITIPKPIDFKNEKIIENLEYIILEAKENSFFGHVTKMRIYKNKIFIFDRRYAQAILIYTIEGKHIATIGNNKGQGPQDFINIHNFEIDYANEQLLIMDNWGRKFMIYNFEGSFVKKIDSKLSVTDAVLLPDGHIVHAKSSNTSKIPNQNDFKLIITDDNQRIVKEGFANDDNRNLRLSCNSLICALFDGGINFAPRFNDTIYSITFDSIIPKYAINFGENNKISKKVIDELNSEMELFRLVDNGGLCFTGVHIESKDFLYLFFNSNDRIAVFYNKQTNKTISISIKRDNKDFARELYELLCSDEDGYFYGAFNLTQTDDLIDHIPELKHVGDLDDLNPILFRYKIKNVE